MRNTDFLFEKLFKKEVSSAQNAEYLADVCTKYPFFSTAQFFLLKQMDKQSAGYNQQVGKTAVFFNNPYWLNFQLNIDDTTTAEETIPVAVEDPLAADNTDQPVSVAETDDIKLSSNCLKSIPQPIQSALNLCILQIILRARVLN